jgi:thioredoxin 2
MGDLRPLRIAHWRFIFSFLMDPFVGLHRRKNYYCFLNSVWEQPGDAMRDAYICSCPHCGTRNRIDSTNLELTAKCGRCHQSFSPHGCNKEITPVLTLRCSQCHTKNRVPVSKLDTGGKCGRCGAVLDLQDVYTGRTVMVTDANLHQTVLCSPLPVLLYGWAPWCSVCSGINSQVEQMAVETKGKIRVAKVNIEANPQIASTYRILSVPTFFIFDAGKLVEQMPGAVPKHELMMKMAGFI